MSLPWILLKLGLGYGYLLSNRFLLLLVRKRRRFGEGPESDGEHMCWSLFPFIRHSLPSLSSSSPLQT